MIQYALACLVAGNLCFGVWSHRTLGRAVRATQDSIVDLVTGRLREVGPHEAQVTALHKQVQAKAQATPRRTRMLNV